MAKGVCVNGYKRPAGAGEDAGERQPARKRRKAGGGGRDPEVRAGRSRREGSGAGPRMAGVSRLRPPFCGVIASHAGMLETPQNRVLLAAELEDWVKVIPAGGGSVPAPGNREIK